METCRAKSAQTDRLERRVERPELTYIYLTEHNVYYAADHNQGVEHIPGISKIALSEAEQPARKCGCEISTKEKSLFSN